MDLMLDIAIRKPANPITYQDQILLMGSCFTEHMAERLALHKFTILSNPHGILFNPLSVAASLKSYVKEEMYTEKDLFYLNELWNSWDHHTRFSDIEKAKALEKINTSQSEAAAFIRNADWIMITLGSAFQYYLQEKNYPVANNHRAPAQWFRKEFLTTETIIKALSESMNAILSINPSAKFFFTISPVRHIRDGVVDNNRSKARLIEAVHTLCEQFSQAYYFPAYEIVIDILRDYRFYDVDFVHPNYLATQYVWEQFSNTCFEPDTLNIMSQLRDIVTARLHRPRFPDTEAHKKFKHAYREKVEKLAAAYPYLNLQEELIYFSG